MLTTKQMNLQLLQLSNTF